MNPLIRLKQTSSVFLVAFVLACFALSPAIEAQLPPPPPDGGYPNNNTAEGDNALFNVTTGTDNTAIGFHALFGNNGGSENTAMVLKPCCTAHLPAKTRLSVFKRYSTT